MKNSLAKKLLLALLLLSTMPTAFCERGKLESFHMQIVGKYFENFKDYQNLEMVNKNFEDIISYYRQNYIPLTDENFKFFENLETYVAIPGENQTRNKLSEKIKHLVFLENSFDFGRFNKVMERNKMTHTPHECRHTFITIGKSNKMDQYILKLIVGHEIDDVTEKFYTHRTIEQLGNENRCFAGKSWLQNYIFKGK